jgi:DNA-binding PadR family transcriptional regulator
MDETEFRILDTLSRDPDQQVSISELTRDIRRLHGTAHYPNVYKSLHQLRKEGVVSLTKTGNTSIVSLDLRSRETADSLSEMELRKRHSLLRKREEFQRLVDSVSDATSVGPTSLIDPEKNIKLNRAELVIQVPNWASSKRNIETLRESLQGLERKLDLRIDALTLNESAFQSLLAGQDKNPLREMLSKQTTVVAPDLFWTQIRNAWAHGIRVHFDREATNPAKISEKDLVYNLARLGYTEFGPRIADGQDFGVEFIVTALLLSGDARRIQAIPILLAKNQANYALLLFLSRKYGAHGKLLGLMQALAKHNEDPSLREAIRILERERVQAAKVNEAAIEETLRTYNALK